MSDSEVCDRRQFLCSALGQAPDYAGESASEISDSIIMLHLSDLTHGPSSLLLRAEGAGFPRQRAQHVSFHLPVLEGRLRPVQGIQPSFGVGPPGHNSEISTVLMQGSLSGVCKYTAPAYDATKNMTIGDM